MCYCLNEHDSAEAYWRSRARWRALGWIIFLAASIILWFGIGLVFSQDSPVPQLPANINMWSVVVGALLPILIAAANRLPIPNYLVALVLCVGAAFGDVYFSGRFNPGDWAQSLLTIFFTVVTSYKAFWQPSGITNRIEGKV